MPQFVRLVNTEDRPFDFHHNNVKRIIAPGRDTVVPWDVAVSLFGDPFLVDTPRNPDRSKSLKQARGVFNYMNGMESEVEFDARRPHIEVWDVESDPPSRIIMLIEDPLGERVSENVVTEGLTEMEALQRRIAALTATVEKLAQNSMQANASQRPDGQLAIPSNDQAPVSAMGGFLIDPNTNLMVTPDLSMEKQLSPAEIEAREIAAAGGFKPGSNAPVVNQQEMQFASQQTGETLMDQFAAQTTVPLPDDNAPAVPVAPEVVPAATTDAPPSAKGLAPRPGKNK